jgi:putative phage-type endonuclease
MTTQGTDEWYAERLGCLSASRISEMLAKTESGAWGASRKNYMAELIAERLTGQRVESFQSHAMERGKEVEQEARRVYSFYNDVSVEEVGFIKHPSIKMAGASPDGLVGGDGMAEFKCPNTATHLEALEGAPIKRVYKLQMQFQMACTGRKWCDFVSYDPRLPEQYAMHQRRVERDQALIDEIEKEALKFLERIEARIAKIAANYEAKR